MNTGDIVSFIIVPLGIFFLASLGTGVTALVKFTAYMARSQNALESTAKTNQEISTKLGRYIEHTDNVLKDHGERLKVVEYVSEQWQHMLNGGSK
jgi:hypothetical protein